MASKETNPAGHRDDFRRTWDKDTFERLAKERLRQEREGDKKTKEPPVHRELLKHREHKVDLDSRLGKFTVITRTTPHSQSGGYYCNVCDCVVKDSINFLDHINGRKHQRNLGMSMKIERSSLDQVKQRFERNKAKQLEEKKEYDFEERMKERHEEEEKLKEYRREKRRERKRRARGDADEQEAEDGLGGLDPELAATMGFAGFGAKKSKS